MRKLLIPIAVISCLVVCARALAEWAPGPPAPVAYEAILDPPDHADRHIVVKTVDRNRHGASSLGFFFRRFPGWRAE